MRIAGSIFSDAHVLPRRGETLTVNQKISAASELLQRGGMTVGSRVDLDALSEVDAAKYQYTCLWSSFTGGLTWVDFSLCRESPHSQSPYPPRKKTGCCRTKFNKKNNLWK